MEKDSVHFLLEHSPVATVITGLDGKVRYGNLAFREFLGGSLETLGNPQEYLHPEDIPRFWECLEKVAKEPGGKEEVFLRTRSREGKIRFTRVILWNAFSIPAIEGIVGYSIDVTRETELTTRVLEEEQLLEALVEQLNVLGEYEDEESISQEAVQAVCKTFGLALAWLGRKEEDFRVVPLAWFPREHPYPGKIEVRWDDSLEGQGPTGKAIRSGVLQICEDILTDPQFLPWRKAAEPYGFRSLVSIPLANRGKTFGTLNCYSTSPSSFTGNRLRFLQLFAQGLASLLLAASSQRSLKRQVEELEAVRNTAVRLRQVERMNEALRVILEDAGRLIDAQAGMVLLDRDGEFILAAQWGFSPPLREFTIKKSNLSPECDLLHYSPRLSADHVECPCIPVPEGFGPSLLLPLLSEEKPLGALFFLRHSGTPSFTERELRLARTISEIGGNTIRRLELHENALKRLAHLETLQVIDRAIAGSLDISLIFQVLLDGVIQEENVHAAAIFLLYPEAGYLRCSVHRGFRKADLKGMYFNPREGILGKVLLENAPLSLEYSHLQEDRVLAQISSGEGFQKAFFFPLSSKGKVLGVLTVFSLSPFSPSPEWQEFLGNLAGRGAIAIENVQLFENLGKSLSSIQTAYDATIEGWAKALELRDRETEGHSQRVTELTLLLAQELGITGEELTYVRWGALLHDIGKLGVPDSILLKPGPLTEKEWAIMRKHPLYAYEMLRDIPHLAKALDIPLYHHERFDGKGYPMGLEGKKIPLPARIFAVVDVYDALTSDRPYRKAWTREKALQYIIEESGKAFDPEVVEAFLRLVRNQ